MADARATRARWGFPQDEKGRQTHGGECDGRTDRFSRKRVGGLNKKGASDIWSDVVQKRRKPMNKLYI